MTDPPDPPADSPLARLDDIGTEWHGVRDPSVFAARYAPAARAYLAALLPDPADADDAAQDFLLRVVERGFGPLDPARGRFRDYLKAALRNAARAARRRQRAGPAVSGLDPDDLAAPDQADGVWRAGWQACLLDRVWDRLADHERQHPAGRAHTVLRSAAAAGPADRPPLPAADRKRLSRARGLFARFLVDEVARTVEPPTRDRVESELADLGLLTLVQQYSSTAD